MAINLKQLTELFGQSAADEELPVPIRRFAAQLTVLTRHLHAVASALRSLETAHADLEKKQDGQIAELADAIVLIKNADAPAAAADTAPPPAGASGPVPGTVPQEDEPEEEESDDERLVREAKEATEADIAEIMAKGNSGKPGAVTPIRPKAPAAGGDAS